MNYCTNVFEVLIVFNTIKILEFANYAYVHFITTLKITPFN